MEVTRKQILMIVLVLGVGCALIYAGLVVGWGLTWIVGGAYFVILGTGAGLITMGQLLPERAGAILNSHRVSVLILCAVLGMMALTVVVSLLDRSK